MRFSGARKAMLLAMWAMCNLVDAQATVKYNPGSLLGGIGNVAGNVANGASNFLSGVVKRQKEVLTKVTDSATDFARESWDTLSMNQSLVHNAVEKPRNLLINATRATTNYIDRTASKTAELKLRRLLEKFRARMSRGIPDLGIPVLEPLELRQVKLSTENEEIGDVKLSMENITIHQLSSFIVDQARLSLLGPVIAVNVTFPEIYANGYYNLNGRLGDMFSLKGAGLFEAVVHKLRIYVKIVLGYSRGMYMKSFDLDFYVDAVELDLENFMGGDKVGRIMNDVLQELTPEAIEVIKPEILPKISDFIASRANDTIYHLTMKEVIGVLIGEGTEIRDIARILVP